MAKTDNPHVFAPPRVGRYIRIFGGLCFPLGALAFIAGSVTSSIDGGAEAFGAGCLALILCCVNGLLLLAGGQGLIYLAQIAHNSSYPPSPAAPVPDFSASVRPLSASPTQAHLRAPRFYYAVGETTRGPVDNAALQRLANAGTINADTYIRPETSDEWKRLEEMLA